MSTRRNFLISSAAVVMGVGAVGIAQAAPQRRGNPTSGPSASTSPTQVATATPVLAEQLRFSRDEERMARDLYAAIAKKYDEARPFSNVTNSEQRHFDALGVLLVRYGVADPAAGRKAGSYANADVQKLYDGWWARAQKSIDEAYQVGIELEKRDIADLEKTLASQLPDDVKSVLERLLAGSENHLAAFTAAANGTLGTGMGGPSKGGQGGQGKSGRRGGMGGQGSGPQDGSGMGRRGGRGQSQADCPLGNR